MNHLAKAFIVYLCVASISCEWFAREADKKSTDDTKTLAAQKSAERSLLIAKLQSMMKATQTNETIIPLPTASTKNETVSSRQKRQLPLAWAGGFGLGYGQYDYNDYYGDYANDYNYDYYDWLCSDTSCKLCDILTSECCDPAIDINCFLPDSCLNNPCLGGGTCITTRTVDLRPDFICVCLPGLTGKYCQLANDYFVGGNIIDPILMAGPPAPIGGGPIGGGPIGGGAGYGGAGGYGAMGGGPIDGGAGYGGAGGYGQQGPIGGGPMGGPIGGGPIGGGPMGGAGGYGQQGPIGGGYGQQGPIGGGYGQQGPIGGGPMGGAGGYGQGPIGGGPVAGGYGQQGPIGGGPIGGGPAAGGYGQQGPIGGGPGPVSGGYGQQGPIGGGPSAGGYGQQQGPIEQAPVQQPAYGQQLAAPQPDQYQQPNLNPQPYAAPAPQQYAAPQPQQYAAPAPQPQPEPQYQPQQPAYGAQPQPAYNQDVAPPTGGQYGVRTMSAKRIKCADGQTYNYAKNSCADFTLKRKVAA